MLAEAARVQGRVLLALMLREARTRYGKRQLGYLWALVEPILWIMGMSFLFSLLGRIAALGDSLIVFLATGLATFLGFRNLITKTKGGYKGEALLNFPIVHLNDVFLARALLELATWVLVSFIILGTLIAIGLGPLPHNFLLMVSAVILLFSIGFGVGAAIGIISEFLPSLGTFMRILMRILKWLSGVFFLPENLFPAAVDVLTWNPVLHGITLFRMGYYAQYDAFTFAPGYLAGWSLCCALLGLLAIRVARRPLRNAAPERGGGR